MLLAASFDLKQTSNTYNMHMHIEYASTVVSRSKLAVHSTTGFGLETLVIFAASVKIKTSSMLSAAVFDLETSMCSSKYNMHIHIHMTLLVSRLKLAANSSPAGTELGSCLWNPES
jgi:hypothetical protein